MFNCFQLSTFNFQLKKLCFLVLGTLVLTACRPKGILSSKQMEDILVDLHTAEGILQEAGYNYGHDEALRGYFLVVLQEHGTTQAQFDSSLVWYTANPTIFDKIYPHVIERLQKQYDTYSDLLESINKGTNMDIDDWLYRCQYGIDKGLWKKNFEKNTKKFVYIKKML